MVGNQGEIAGGRKELRRGFLIPLHESPPTVSRSDTSYMRCLPSDPPKFRSFLRLEHYNFCAANASSLLLLQLLSSPVLVQEFVSRRTLQFFFGWGSSKKDEAAAATSYSAAGAGGFGGSAGRGSGVGMGGGMGVRRAGGGVGGGMMRGGGSGGLYAVSAWGGKATDGTTERWGLGGRGGRRVTESAVAAGLGKRQETGHRGGEGSKIGYLAIPVQQTGQSVYAAAFMR